MGIEQHPLMTARLRSKYYERGMRPQQIGMNQKALTL